MPPRIRSFGSHGLLPFAITEEETDHITQQHRELWFERDIDGRWLVCAATHRADGLDRDGDPAEAVGAIVVKDPHVIAFIEMLGELVTDPARFRHEPVLDPPSERPRDADG